MVRYYKDPEGKAVLTKDEDFSPKPPPLPMQFNYDKDNELSRLRRRVAELEEAQVVRVQPEQSSNCRVDSSGPENDESTFGHSVHGNHTH